MTNEERDTLIKLLRDKTQLARFGIPEIKHALEVMKAAGYEIKKLA